MEMSHDPAAAAIDTQVSENALSGVAAGASEGIHMLASDSEAQTELHRAGEAVQDIARTYTDVDTSAAGVLA